MTGGHILALFGLAGALAGVTLFAARLPDDDEIIGDLPRVPNELRPSGKEAGGGPSMAREPLTGLVAHHDGSGR